MPTDDSHINTALSVIEDEAKAINQGERVSLAYTSIKRLAIRAAAESVLIVAKVMEAEARAKK